MRDSKEHELKFKQYFIWSAYEALRESWFGNKNVYKNHEIVWQAMTCIYFCLSFSFLRPPNCKAPHICGICCHHTSLLQHPTPQPLPTAEYISSTPHQGTWEAAPKFHSQLAHEGEHITPGALLGLNIHLCICIFIAKFFNFESQHTCGGKGACLCSVSTECSGTPGFTYIHDWIPPAYKFQGMQPCSISRASRAEIFCWDIPEIMFLGVLVVRWLTLTRYLALAPFTLAEGIRVYL